MEPLGSLPQEDRFASITWGSFGEGSAGSATLSEKKPRNPFFEGGRVSQTLHEASKTLFDST